LSWGAVPVLTPLLYTTGINSLLIVYTSSTGTLIVFHNTCGKTCGNVENYFSTGRLSLILILWNSLLSLFLSSISFGSSLCILSLD